MQREFNEGLTIYQGGPDFSDDGKPQARHFFSYSAVGKST
jgi:hypothetical protein